MTSPIDAVLGQIGLPNGMAVRTCTDHGKFLVPKGYHFACPMCSNLHSTPDGTGGNGPSPERAMAESNAINAIKHYIHLG